MKPASEKLPGIQVLRAIAAIMVVVYHLTLHAEQWFGSNDIYALLYFANVGVDLFFVISGFIIYYVHQDAFGSWRSVPDFLARRVGRIFPPYWVVLVITILANTAMGSEGGHESVAGILHGILLIYGFYPVIVGVSWTLSYEMLFYIGFALMLPLKRSIALGGLLAWGFACLVFAQAASTMMLSVWVAEFCAGVLVAAGLHGRFSSSGWGLTMALLAMIGFGGWAAAPVEHQSAVIRSVMVLLAIIAVTIAANYRGNHEHPLSNILILLGEASYAIYLTHYLAIQAVYVVMRKLDLLRHFDPLLFNFGILLPCLVAIGMIFHIFVERPLCASMRNALFSARAAVRMDRAV